MKKRKEVLFKLILFSITILVFFGCNKKAKCPSYLEIETISVAEAGTYQPAQTGYFQVTRSKKTGMIKDGRKRQKNGNKVKVAKKRITHKGFYKDPSMFHDKKNKRPGNLRGKKKFPWINFSRIFKKKNKKNKKGAAPENESAPSNTEEKIGWDDKPSDEKDGGSEK